MSLRSRKKAATRDALIEAALRLFLEHGYDATPIAAIAEATGVAPRTFFRYFAAKEDVVFHDIAVYRDAFSAVAAHPRRGESGMAAARRGALAVASEVEARIDGLRPRLALLPQNPALIAKWAELDAFWLAGFLALLAKDHHPDAHLLAGALVGGVNAALAGFAMGQGDPLHDQVNRLFDLLS